MNSTQQIGIKITLCHSLNAGVRMRGDPSRKRDVKLQEAVRCRAMARLANEPKQQPWPAIVSYREANRVAGTVLRQPTALCSITQIAMLVKILIGWGSPFVARRGAVSLPAATQRQARRMLPAGIVEFAGRHKKWASHEIFSLGKSNCIR